MHTFLRYAHLLALLATILVVVALTLFYRQLVFDSLVEEETRSNVALTKAFANSIWTTHAGFVQQAAATPSRELPAREEIKQ